MSVPHLDIVINEENLNEGAQNVLIHIRPNWEQTRIKFKLLTDGITNKLIKCDYGEDPAECVLVRVYGRKTDLLIDRTAETRNIILLHNEKLAPELYATFENGLVYEFAPGDTLTTKTVPLPNIFRLVARQMAKLHLVKANNDNNPQPMIWRKLEQFYNLIPDVFTESQVQKRFLKLNITKERLQGELKLMRRVLNKYNSPIVFCHNDLLLGNVIYNSEKRIVTFIDYEYSDVNYQAFDIGNHFNEFAGVEDIDYKLYPSKVLQLAWLCEYLQTYTGRKDITHHELEDMYVKVQKYGLLSHLLWGLWALIQAEHSTIDFDFLRFGDAHLSRYFDTRDEVLALDVVENDCKSKSCFL